MNTRAERFTDPSRFVWCAGCYLRITPDDLHTVFNDRDYHRHCFEKWVIEQSQTNSRISGPRRKPIHGLDRTNDV